LPDGSAKICGKLSLSVLQSAIFQVLPLLNVGGGKIGERIFGKPTRGNMFHLCGEQ